jgi:hypothetical protein
MKRFNSYVTIHENRFINISLKGFSISLFSFSSDSKFGHIC